MYKADTEGKSETNRKPAIENTGVHSIACFGYVQHRAETSKSCLGFKLDGTCRIWDFFSDTTGLNSKLV